VDPATALRANEVLERLLELAPQRRPAAIDDLCDGDPGLAALVRRLLAHAEAEQASPVHVPGAALHRGLGALFEAPSRLGAGRIGPYRLLRRLGIGGSAEVMLGEREVDGVVQQVAIKFLRADVASQAGLARFRQEQQILARLSHPAIGRIHDIGLTDGGAPYFVMEYIDGEPIDAWCDRRRLGIDARLRLFVQVADAVAHAHRALVIHRDIKPGNVLVDADGHPRLLDFGIAKVLDDTDTPALTEPGGAPATLGYASPEQLRGGPLGITSDVYQLGMLLYVLVAGSRPVLPRGASRSEAAQLADAQPLLPSQRLRRMHADGVAAAIAEQRRLDVRHLLRALSGDLDAIVARAIAADPEARYPSAVHLADDVRNLLDGRPVSARRRSVRYALGKSIRRHPVAFALAALLAASITGFAVVVASIALDLERARRSAVLQGQLADRVLDHVIATLRELEPGLSGFDGSIVRHALDRASSAPAAQFGEDPRTQAHLRMTLGRGYEALWAIDEANEQYLAAAAQVPALAGDERRRLQAAVDNGLGRVARVQGDAEAAMAAFRRVIAATDGDREAVALNASARANLATLLGAAGDRAGSLALQREAADDFERVYGGRHPNTLALQLNIALTLLDEEGLSAPADIAAALAVLEPLHARAREALGAEAPLVLTMHLLLGRARCHAGDTVGGERALASALPAARRVLGEQSLQVLKARSELGLARVRLGQHAQGLEDAAGASAEFIARWDGHGRHSSRHGFGLNLAHARWLLGDGAGAREALRAHAVDRELVARSAGLQGLSIDETADGG
jgi:eukaryotic-like serine/threonine-protein kinase